MIGNIEAVLIPIVLGGYCGGSGNKKLGETFNPASILESNSTIIWEWHRFAATFHRCKLHKINQNTYKPLISS